MAEKLYDSCSITEMSDRTKESFIKRMICLAIESFTVDEEKKAEIRGQVIINIKEGE